MKYLSIVVLMILSLSCSKVGKKSNVDFKYVLNEVYALTKEKKYSEAIQFLSALRDSSKDFQVACITADAFQMYNNYATLHGLSDIILDQDAIALVRDNCQRAKTSIYIVLQNDTSYIGSTAENRLYFLSIHELGNWVDGDYSDIQNYYKKKINRDQLTNALQDRKVKYLTIHLDRVNAEILKLKLEQANK